MNDSDYITKASIIAILRLRAKGLTTVTGNSIIPTES
jgi:hypothetical protein